jgi:hypothetical protein
MEYPDTIVLTPAAEEYIDRLACDLITGSVELWQLSPALLTFWTFAYEAGGGVHVQRKLDNLEARNDALYLRAYNTPQKIREIQQRRLDAHFQTEADTFYTAVSA